MAEVGVATGATTASTSGRWLSSLGRQRELSLIVLMLVMGGLVSLAAPQFLSISNLSQVAVLAAIIAVAAVGESLVVITRNVDLSVEAVMGLVAYCVAFILEQHALDTPVAIAFGIGLGLVLGMVNGVIVTVFRVPAIVATLGTLSIFRGLDYLIAGSHEVPVGGLPPGFTDAAHGDFLGLPIFVIIAFIVAAIGTIILRWSRFGRQLYAVGSNPEAAEIIGIPSRRVVFTAFALCGLLGGVAGVLWVIEFGVISGTAATGVILAVIAAVVVGGVNIFGGSGTLAGAALGALFLGLIANALILVGLSQFWLQAIYGVVILAAVTADALIQRGIVRAAAQGRVR